MATINLGRVKPVFRGAYSGATAYVVDDIVTYSNETYICILASTGNLPTDTTYWTKLAAKGTDGTDLTTTLTTQGDILYRDASGLARLGAGTAGQVLQTGGAGANPSWANSSGGMMELVTRTAITSTVGSVEFTNLEADNYHKFVFQGIDSTNNGGEDFGFQLSENNGSSYIGSSYLWSYWQHYSSGSNNQTASSGTSAIYMADGFHTSGADEGLHGEMTISNIGNGQRPFAWFQTAHKADATNKLRATSGSGFLESGVTVNAIKFFFDTGSITGSSYAFINHYKGVIA